MDGVNILATNIASSGDFVLGVVVVFISIVFSAVVVWIAIEEEDPSTLLLLILLGVMCCGGYTLTKNNVGRTQYIATVSKEVKLDEFTRKYDVISQNGQLYTIEEKIQE